MERILDFWYFVNKNLYWVELVNEYYTIENLLLELHKQAKPSPHDIKRFYISYLKDFLSI